MNTIYNLAFLLLFQFLFPFDLSMELPQSFSLQDGQQIHSNKAATANIIFTSADGGQTWQDMSEGLPVNLRALDFFANESGLYLHSEDGLYHRAGSPYAASPFWEKEVFPGKQVIAPGKSGIFAFNNDGQLLEKKNGTHRWLPVYPSFKSSDIRSVFETAGGTVFISSHNGLFKSTDKGKSWKFVGTNGWVLKIVESNGVLLATSQGGILRSTDDGENWNWVISEGGVGIDVENIHGGFAAITFNTQSQTRRVRVSYDGGKTWQAIDTGLPGQVFSDAIWPPAGLPAPGYNDSAWHPIAADLPALAFISSIVQLGENFFCGHPDGIYSTSDKGKTWKRILPSIKGRVFQLSVSGNVMYAFSRNSGC